MAQLSTKIVQYVGSEVDFDNEVKLQNDGQGDYIKEWNLDRTSDNLLVREVLYR